MHFLQIHKGAMEDVWDNTPDYYRAIIAADAEHKTNEFRVFTKKVNDSAEARYNSLVFPPNDPYTFKYEQ